MTPLGYYNKTNCTGGTSFVICAGAAGEIGYCYEDFWAADDCTYFECSDLIMDRYLYFVLKSNQGIIDSKVRRSSIPRLSKENLEKLKIVIPTIEKQQEIVNILDEFDKLTNDIAFGLPAEISARHKQYEYYRDKLLTFREV